jgi:malto-oligosyltrehalose trehalohydrolase
MSLTRDFTPYDSRRTASGHVSSGAPVRRSFPKSWGAEHVGENSVLFRLWAPDIERLRLRIAGRNREMLPAGQGWFTLTVEGVEPGTPYQFVMPDGKAFADPASRAQDGGVNGHSTIVDPAFYRWNMPAWKGHAWEEAVIYEMHIGTFTSEGTFRAAASRLADLADLGFTVIQLMPVSEFPGDRGWGYDSALPYAPHHAYGSPDDMKAFVDAAHRVGLSVMLDVVYNHFGPAGNLIVSNIPSFFDPQFITPWGPSINFAQPAVRAFFIENALYWLEEFNLDGLRIDAVDEILDETSEKHILVELAERVHSETTGRRRHLVMEDHRAILRNPERGGTPDAFVAGWNNDAYHAAHVIATGEAVGHAGPFAAQPVAKLAACLAHGGMPSQDDDEQDARSDADAGGSSPLTSYIHFLQNHDHVGNRAHGERLISLSEPGLLDVMTSMLLLSPQVPMMFMGEEYGEVQPFAFFAEYEGDIAMTTWANRLIEAEKFGGLPEGVTEPWQLDNPNAPEAFEKSKLRWERRDTAEGSAAYGKIRDLIGKRREHVVPGLSGMPHSVGRVLASAPETIAIDWQLSDRLVQLRANLSASEVEAPGISGFVIHRVPETVVADGTGPLVMPATSLFAAISRH